MPKINPYEPPQSDKSTMPQAQSAPEPVPYPSWVTRLIGYQTLLIVLTFVFAVGFINSTAADETWHRLALGLSEDTWRWVLKSCFLLIEVLAIILLSAAFKYRIYWLLISELALFLPAAIGFVIWMLDRWKR